MTVFKIKPNTKYITGVALIAADSANQAIDIYCKSSDETAYKYDEYNCSCTMMYGLSYNTDKPCIIIDCINE